MQRLIDGYKAFRTQYWPEEKARYETLATRGQSPEYLVISCSDSRADPATIFNAGPGELFVVRNVAGIVPPFESDAGHHGTSAAIAFAVTALKVKNILVLGHAQCGGIAAALDRKVAAGVPFLQSWIELLAPVIDRSVHIGDHAQRHVAMERDAIRLSLQNLMTFPFVAERVKAGALALHGGRFGIANGELEMLDQNSGAFAPVEI